MGVDPCPSPAGEFSSGPALGIVSWSRHNISDACMTGDEAGGSDNFSSVGLGSTPRLASVGCGGGGGGGPGSGCGAIGDKGCIGGCCCRAGFGGQCFGGDGHSDGCCGVACLGRDRFGGEGCGGMFARPLGGAVAPSACPPSTTLSRSRDLACVPHASVLESCAYVWGEKVGTPGG